MEISDQRGDWGVPIIPSFDKMDNRSMPVTAKMPPDYVDEHDDMNTPHGVDAVKPLVTPSNFIGTHAPEGVPATVVSAPTVGAAQVKTGNTPSPVGGIVLNGYEATAKPVHDPWSAPSAPAGVTVVQRGATVKMGGNK